MTHPLGRVFIVGIGGAGMSGLARLLHAQGAVVAGSDAKASKRTSALISEGIEVVIGHAAENLLAADGQPAFDTVAASTAVPANNPELKSAVDLGLRVMNRADLLCAITDPYRVASVAGTHGKTTTTSMLTVALQHAGWDPSFAIGSELNETGSNAHLGTGDVFVVEADESDGTFLTLRTEAAIVTNVEPDHLNYWGTFDRLEQAFMDFARALPARGGFLVVCEDDLGAAALAKSARTAGVDVRSYGVSTAADYRIVPIASPVAGWHFSVEHASGRVAELALAVPGAHNALNATAALLAAVGLGAPAAAVAEGISRFTGTRRRFDYKGTADSVRVFDDYAHHPTEIAATLRAAREVAGNGRVVVAFQAHHYYRTALFSVEFGQALGLADEVVVLEVFAPGEEFIPGASGQTLAGNVTLPPSQVCFEPSWSKVSAELVDRARPGDIIMTLGAGEIGMLTGEILELLASREAARDQG